MKRTHLHKVVLALSWLALAGVTACSKEDADSPKTAAEHDDAHGKEHEHKEEAPHGGEHSDAEHESADAHSEEGHGAAGESVEHVRLTPAQVKRADIGLAEAGPAQIREHIALYGVITPNAERMREVTARFPGAIRTLTKRVGESVRQGETLATIESNESLQTYAVVAPLSGVITARNANPGEQAGDKPLFTVVDLSTVWVDLSVFPRDVGKIRVGQEVRIQSADTAGRSLGKVVYVAPFGTSSNQTLSARVLVDNAQGTWPPGLYVTAEVLLSSSPAPLTVASTALQTLEQRSVVFVQCDLGFEPRAVQLGRTDGEITEVIAGLDAGDRYATSNSFILKAELGKGTAEHGH